MIDTAQVKGLKITIGYTYYYDPPAQEMRRIIQKGILGEILHVESFFGYNLDGPFGSLIMSNPDHWVHKLPGKLFHNNLNHAIHKVTEFLPDEHPEIQVVARRLRQQQSYGDVRNRMLDELRVLIAGEKVTGYVTFSSHIRSTVHLARIYSTQNCLIVDWVARTVVIDAYLTLLSALGRLFLVFTAGRRYLGQGLKI